MKHDKLPPLKADDPTTDAEKNVILRNAIDEAAQNDPTRFTTRSFAVLENKDHSLRLINRNDARQAISIPWDDLSALRTIIDIATQNTTTTADAATPATPSNAAMRAAEEIAEELINPILSHKQRPLRDFEILEIAAIITRHLAGTPAVDAYTIKVAIYGWTLGLADDRLAVITNKDIQSLADRIIAATTSPEIPEFPKCVKCGHDNVNSNNGMCIEFVVPRNSNSGHRCGCKCEFTAPVATGDDEGESPDAVTLIGTRLAELRQYTSYRFVLVKRELEALLAALRTPVEGEKH